MSLFGNLKSFSSNIAVIDENSNKYSYRDLLKNVENIRKHFKSRDTIFLIGENTFEFLSCYVALIRNRSIIFLIEKSLSNEKLKFLIKNYRPKYILSPKKIDQF